MQSYTFISEEGSAIEIDSAAALAFLGRPTILNIQLCYLY